MRSVLITILAATAVAMPISLNFRQLPGLGSATSPLTTVLSEVGKQVPSAASKAEDAIGSEKKNSTQPSDNKNTKAASGLGGLTGILGGLTGGLGGI